MIMGFDSAYIYRFKESTKDRKYLKVAFSWDNKIALEMSLPLKYKEGGLNHWRNYEIIKWLEYNVEKARNNAPKNEFRCGKTMMWYIDSGVDDEYNYDTYVFFRDDVPEETIIHFTLKFG